MEPKELLEVAREAMGRAYAPYSGFRVGAAVLGKSGGVYTGCNVENAAYDLSVCAERVAVFRAIAEGDAVSAVAVFSQTGNSQPCGACRQVIMEFNPNARVYFLTHGRMVVKRAGDLLPESFTSACMD